MSKNYWQIKKQAEQLPAGAGPTSRIEAYVQTWQQRCYRDLIPDDLPDGLLFSGRAPSWKAIAICLLQNDFRLHKLGYTTTPGEWAQAAIELSNRQESAQESLFDGPNGWR
jgi:predicted phosphoadenosine phosphosulfate sulfurtransferase